MGQCLLPLSKPVLRRRKLWNSFGLLNQINNSCESKELIDEKITNFLDFMNEIIVKGDEVRIPI